MRGAKIRQAAVDKILKVKPKSSKKTAKKATGKRGTYTRTPAIRKKQSAAMKKYWAGAGKSRKSGLFGRKGKRAAAKKTAAKRGRPAKTTAAKTTKRKGRTWTKAQRAAHSAKMKAAKRKVPGRGFKV